MGLHNKYFWSSNLEDDVKDWSIECSRSGSVKKKSCQERFPQRHWRMILDYEGLHETTALTPDGISLVTEKRNYSGTNLEW